MTDDSTHDDRLSSFVGSRLLIIMSNPPLGTSGERTRRRVTLLETLLQARRLMTANLFAVPTYRTGDISVAGQESAGWLNARAELRDGINSSDAVVLAYGSQEPTGTARTHFRSQITWMHDELRLRDVPIWTVGGRPLHPSRWHRHTFRAHEGKDFPPALLDSLTRFALPVTLE